MTLREYLQVIRLHEDGSLQPADRICPTMVQKIDASNASWRRHRKHTLQACPPRTGMD